ADTATLEWLLEWLEKEQDTILSARAYSSINTHKRRDVSVVIQYVSRFFKQRHPDLRSGYGYGVQLLAQIPSLENNTLLESIVLDKTLHRDERKYALEALIRLNHPTTDKILSQILMDPNEEEALRETTVRWLTEQNQLDQKEK